MLAIPRTHSWPIPTTELPKHTESQTIAKNAKPKINAATVYENAHLVAQDLVTRIGELLFNLPAPGNDEHPIS